MDAPQNFFGPPQIFLWTAKKMLTYTKFVGLLKFLKFPLPLKKIPHTGDKASLDRCG